MIPCVAWILVLVKKRYNQGMKAILAGFHNISVYNEEGKSY